MSATPAVHVSSWTGIVRFEISLFQQRPSVFSGEV